MPQPLTASVSDGSAGNKAQAAAFRRREAVLTCWVAGGTVADCAEAGGLSESSIYRILREARADGDERAVERSPEEISMAKQKASAGVVLDHYKSGRSIESIAAATGLRRDEVQAVIYRAVKGGATNLGLQIGGDANV